MVGGGSKQREHLYFEGEDLAATASILGQMYTRTQIRRHGRPSTAKITRHWLGDITIDELAFSYTMDYQAPKLGRVCICRVHSGHIATRSPCLPSEVTAAGDVTVYPASESPHSGQVRHAAFDLTMFDAAQLTRVASPARQARTDEVILTSHKPISANAGRRLSALIDYLRDEVLGSPEAMQSPLLVSAAVQGLAATVLTVLPNTAELEPDFVDRRDSRPVLLRRATAFIDENVQADVALADIAAAISVTPRAVQYMFRRHLDMSPMEYLRRARLRRAHEDLVAQDVSVTTVGAVARKWGFTNYASFVARYRREYDCSPYKTLLNSGS